jgi:hypothetical protein
MDPSHSNDKVNNQSNVDKLTFPSPPSPHRGHGPERTVTPSRTNQRLVFKGQSLPNIANARFFERTVTP